MVKDSDGVATKGYPEENRSTKTGRWKIHRPWLP